MKNPVKKKKKASTKTKAGKRKAAEKPNKGKSKSQPVAKKKAPPSKKEISAKDVFQLPANQIPRAWKEYLKRGGLSKKEVALIVAGTTLGIVKSNRMRNTILYAWAKYLPRWANVIGIVQLIANIVHGYFKPSSATGGWWAKNVASYLIGLYYKNPANIVVHEYSKEQGKQFADDHPISSVPRHVIRVAGSFARFIGLSKRPEDVRSMLDISASFVIGDQNQCLSKLLSLGIESIEFYTILRDNKEWNPTSLSDVIKMTDDQRRNVAELWSIKLAEAERLRALVSSEKNKQYAEFFIKKAKNILSWVSSTN